METESIGIVGFDPEYDVLIDQMEIMLTRGYIEWLEEKIALHKRHSKKELQAIGLATVARLGPGIVGNFNPDYFKD